MIQKAVVIFALVACAFAVERANVDEACKEICHHKTEVTGEDVGECGFKCNHKGSIFGHFGVHPDGASCKTKTDKVCQDGHCITPAELETCKKEADEHVDECVHHCVVPGHHHHVHIVKPDGAECHVHWDIGRIHILSYGGVCEHGECKKTHDHDHDDDTHHHTTVAPTAAP